MGSKSNWFSSVQEGLNKIDGDVDFLIKCLKEVFEELNEKELAKIVPLSDGNVSSGPLPNRGAQAISIIFQLLNLVEENAAQQAIRRRESQKGAKAESGLWLGYLDECRKNKVSSKQILDRIKKQRIEAVLTGHPTEAKRWTVLEQHRKLYVLLVELENQMYTLTERDKIRDQIKAVLEHLWRTGEILMTKPDVRSERLNALYYLKEKFPEVLSDLDHRFEKAWNQSGYGNRTELNIENYPKLHFGSWVGGDRDGHPLITSDVTAETLQELRLNAFQVIDRHLATMEKQFGLSIYGQPVPLMLADRLKKLKRILGPACEKRIENNEEEPWRQFIVLMRCRLDMPHNKHMQAYYKSPTELTEDLDIFTASLQEVGAQRLVDSDVFPLQRIVSTFGFHLASLDIRQNSAFHDKAVAQLLESVGINPKFFLTGTEEERLEFLNNELKSLRPFSRIGNKLGPEATSVIDAYSVIFKHIEAYGRSGVGAFIVSMTRSLSDLLVVYLLCREAGLMRQSENGPICLVPVVPLFETIDDLGRSAEIMDTFLQHPITKNSIPYLDRGLDEVVFAEILEKTKKHLHHKAPYNVQQIMLGYSDSNKDSGIFASQWKLQEAQDNLIRIAKKHGMEFQFFHGRGGTVSRGAGPTHRFLEALPEGSLQTGLRVTEQGETIAQKYTNFRTATYNLELLLAGTAGVSLSKLDRKGEGELRDAMTLLADISRNKYRTFLEDPDFISFYRQATPIDVLEVSRIGSRPSRRTGQMSLDDLRAIPWVFSWTQARFYFPGWFGAGTAIKELRMNHPDLYQAMAKKYNEWPFLRYVLYNLESGLASAKTEWMKAYGSLVKSKSIRVKMLTVILDEFKTTQDELNQILGGELEVRRPRFAKTLKDREAGLDILHQEQIRLLKKWRGAKSRKEADELLPSLLLTVNAIASGLRTTG